MSDHNLAPDLSHEQNAEKVLRLSASFTFTRLCYYSAKSLKVFCSSVVIFVCHFVCVCVSTYI